MEKGFPKSRQPILISLRRHPYFPVKSAATPGWSAGNIKKLLVSIEKDDHLLGGVERKGPADRSVGLLQILQNRLIEVPVFSPLKLDRKMPGRFASERPLGRLLALRLFQVMSGPLI